MASSAEKTRITRDWIEGFPAFAKYRPMWLLKRNGPLLTGICLEIRSNKEIYHPLFHVDILCDPLDVVTLTLWNPLPNKKKTYHEFVSIKQHDSIARDLITRFEKHSPLPLGKRLNLYQALEAFEAYPGLGFPSGSYPISLYSDMLCLLIYCGKIDEARIRLEEFVTRMKTWEPKILGIPKS